MQYFVLLSECRALNFNRLALEKKMDWIHISSSLPGGERGRVTYCEIGVEYTLRQIVVYLSEEITVYILGRAGGAALH